MFGKFKTNSWPEWHVDRYNSRITSKRIRCTRLMSKLQQHRPKGASRMGFFELLVIGAGAIFLMSIPAAVILFLIKARKDNPNG